jgi:hypothetical protein
MALWQELLFRSVIPALLVWVIGIVIHLPLGANRRQRADQLSWRLDDSVIVDSLAGYRGSSQR